MDFFPSILFIALYRASVHFKVCYPFMYSWIETSVEHNTALFCGLVCDVAQLFQPFEYLDESKLKVVF